MSFDSAPINLTHHFLIAMPGLEDESFARSVVYLCEHSERGALGLIINKPTDITLKGLFDKVDLSLRREDLTKEPVFQGGPVQTERGFVLHEPMLMDKGETDESAYASTMTIPGGLEMTHLQGRARSPFHWRRSPPRAHHAGVFVLGRGSVGV